MKKLFLFLALGASVAFTSCNKDDDSPNSNDEIVGTWIDRFEEGDSYVDTYVFNGDNTGNFTGVEGGEVIDNDSFTWSKVFDKYLVTYDYDKTDVETYTIGEIDGEKVLLYDGDEPSGIKQ